MGGGGDGVGLSDDDTRVRMICALRATARHGGQDNLRSAPTAAGSTCSE